MNNKMNVYLVDDSMEMIHSMKEALTKSDGIRSSEVPPMASSVSMSCAASIWMSLCWI